MRQKLAYDKYHHPSHRKAYYQRYAEYYDRIYNLLEPAVMRKPEPVENPVNESKDCDCDVMAGYQRVRCLMSFMQHSGGTLAGRLREHI